MKIAFVQFLCSFGEVEKNLLRARELILSADADLYVLPELFNTGYVFLDRAEAASFAEEIPDGKTARFLAKLAVEKKCYIVAGLAEKSDGRVYNSSLLTGPQGFITTYRKIHLFSEEKVWFDLGNEPFKVVDIGLAKIGLMICFDWIFPESMRSLALQGADIVCHPSNLVLPYCPDAMVTRCIENRVFAVTANRIGYDQRNGKKLSFIGMSQITGPLGEVLCRASKDREEIKVVEIDVQQARNKNITEKNHVLQDRRPEMYSL